ncbi:MAG TPA: hypothetical protein VLA95_04755 [Gemmatimonadales bacterium]|nr:hypothetical protein [Gemmatimonadales bacterium]
MTPTENRLLDLLAQAVRGPRREGLFALWLVCRVAEGVLLEPPVGDRAHRRRVTALEQRLSSLTLPTPLRRALAGALAELREPRAGAAAAALAQLVAPAREGAGAEAAQAVAEAAARAKTIAADRP